MIVTQADVLATTLAESTLLEVREVTTLQRTFSFKNLTDDTLAVKIQASLDGGATWNDVEDSFNIPTGDVSVKTVTSNGILRIRCSGVTDEAGMMVSYSRFVDTVSTTWTSPVL